MRHWDTEARCDPPPGDLRPTGEQQDHSWGHTTYFLVRLAPSATCTTTKVDHLTGRLLTPRHHPRRCLTLHSRRPGLLLPWLWMFLGRCCCCCGCGCSWAAAAVDVPGLLLLLPWLWMFPNQATTHVRFVPTNRAGNTHTADGLHVHLCFPL